MSDTADAAAQMMRSLDEKARTYGDEKAKEVEGLISAAFSEALINADGSITINFSFLTSALALAFMGGAAAALVEVTTAQELLDKVEAEKQLEQVLLKAEGSTQTGAA